MFGTAGYMRCLISIAVVVLSYCAFGSVASADVVPDGFVNVKEQVPNIDLDIRYFTEENFVGEPIDGYEAANCILTDKAAASLGKVQAELNAFGFGLKLFDCYRPQRAVDHFARWARDLDDTRMKARYYPDVAKKDLFASGYIAEKSGHSRGSTVDVTIVSLDQSHPQALDMGTGWDFFGPESAPTSKAVTPAQRAHRVLLRTLMLKHGFKPLSEEWWHFTLVDEPFPDTYFDFAVK